MTIRSQKLPRRFWLPFHHHHHRGEKMDSINMPKFESNYRYMDCTDFDEIIRLRRKKRKIKLSPESSSDTDMIWEFFHSDS